MNTLVLALSIYSIAVTLGLVAVAWDLFVTRMERDAWQDECGRWARTVGLKPQESA